MLVLSLYEVFAEPFNKHLSLAVQTLRKKLNKDTNGETNRALWCQSLSVRIQ